MLPLADGRAEMPLYTFYPCQSDGCSTTWLCAELEDDKAAIAYAHGALAAHPSAVSISVFEGDRDVARATRPRLRFDQQVLRDARASIAASREVLDRTKGAARKDPGV
jgi:hypothetical protein